MEINSDNKIYNSNPSYLSSATENKEVDQAYNEAVERIENSTKLTHTQKADLKNQLDEGLSEASTPEEKMMVIEQTKIMADHMEKGNDVIESLPTSMKPRMFGLS